MKIRHKILIGYLSVLAVFMVLTFVALWNLWFVHRSCKDLVEQRVANVREIHQVLEAFEFEALMLRTYLLTGYPEYEEEFSRQAQRAEEYMAKIEKRLTSKEEKLLFASLKQGITGFTEGYAPLVIAIRERPDLTEQEKLAEVIRFTIDRRGTVRGIIAQGEEYIAYQVAMMEEVIAANEQQVTRLIAITSGLGAFSLLLGVLVAFYISRSISRPLRRLEEQVNRIASGDLTPQELIVASRDEIGQLARSLGVMLTALHQLGSWLQASGEEIGHLAEDLRKSASDAAAASGRTTTALSRFTEVFQSLSQRRKALAGVSDCALAQAGQMQESTARVLRQMESSVKVAARANRAVRDLNATLLVIRETLEFISEFAEQADSLARKAAEELPPEDEKGRAFLSLVHEIRMRALEAARGTKQVDALIAAVQEHTQEAITSVEEDCRLVGEGRIAVQKAIEAFNGLVEEVRGMTEQIEESVEAGRQLSLSLEEVVRASQEQISFVEKVAKASSTLNGMAGELQETLRKLKV